MGMVDRLPLNFSTTGVDQQRPFMLTEGLNLPSLSLVPAVGSPTVPLGASFHPSLLELKF